MGTDERALLDAGAVLPVGGPDAGDDTDVLTARAYRHPALDGRTVVRLVTATLGSAEDLSLEYLGFAGGEADAAPVGRVLRQSLGFPAWALVNDPDNGHHALAVVKEMERLTRLIATKPGHAKDGFEEIGRRLDRSVPQFLPTYYEQVARLFLTGEARQYATSFFGKARAAEQQHALPVDEDRLREVFVEFASAGALSAKTLRDHAKGLSQRLTPGEAFAQFKALCLQRCAAGLAPYAGLLEDLRRLAKAAGCDVAAEERGLLAELLATGSIERAAVSFWKAARGALIELARADGAVCERLLALLPAAGGDSREEFDESWLSLLDAAGAVDLLLSGAVPAADWLSRWAEHRKRGWGRHGRVPAELTLVERLAGRLRAEGRPVELFGSGSWRTTCDIDLLDVCLAGGVPVTDPSEHSALPLSTWLSDRTEGRREPAALVADRRFTPLLRAAVEQLAGEGDGPARLLDVVASPVLAPVVAGWLAERADDLSEPFGLPELNRQLDRLARFDAPAVLATAPGPVAAISATGLAPALARTLRGGVLDELGWPALEDALARLGGPARPSGAVNSWVPAQDWYRLHDAWPAVVVRLGTRVVLVGPDEVLEERALTLPAAATHSWDEPAVRYVDGQWLVISGYGDEQRGVWSGRPADLFRPSGDDLDDRWQRLSTASLALPGGGRSFGGRPVHAGDTSFGARRELAGDGISYWVELAGEWHEFDAATGAHGRRAVPAFFDSGLAEADGAQLVESSCRLMPLPAGLEASPFGCKDGLLGWWVRRNKDGSLTACSVDGARSTITPAAAPGAPGRRRASGDELPLPPLRLPGGAVLHPRIGGQEVRLCDADEVQLGSVQPGSPGDAFADGTPLVPPLRYWHALRPRDERGSAALRAVTVADADALLAAVAAGRTPQEAVAAALPAITHPALVKGVTAVVALAATYAERVARFAEKARRPVAAAPLVARFARDGVLNEALGGLLDGGRVYGRHSDDQSSSAMAQVHAVLRVTDGSAPEHGGRLPLRATPVGWLGLIGTGLAAAAWRAASPSTGEADREAVLEFLEAALGGADTPLADPRGRLRVIELCGPTAGVEDRVGQVLRAGERVLLVLACLRVHDDRRHWSALEYHPAGDFGAWEGFDLKSSRVLGEPGDPARGAGVRRMVELLRERGPLPARREQAESFARSAGVDPSAAAMLLLGLPGADGYRQQGIPGKEVLDAYGLTPASAELARVMLPPLDLSDRRRTLAELVPLDPDATARLWDEGIDPAEVTRGWLARFGRRPVVPAELLARAKREGVRPDLVVRALSPEHQSELTGRTEQRLKDGWLAAADPSALLTGNELTSYAYALRWLAYRLPYGDPLRAILPRTLHALRERLADPGLLLDLGVDWTPEGEPTSAGIRAAYGLPETGGETADGWVAAGPALVLTTARYGQREEVWVRGAAVAAGPDAGPDHPALALLAAAVPQSRAVRALRDVLGEELARSLSADGPAGAPQDPTAVVPELVEEAAGRLECSPDAAALYLMLLALPDPTDRNTAVWTGWKPARLKGARAELAAGGLVVEAKRARAGRTLFLPGGWQEKASPLLPVEVWKAPLFDERRDGFTVPECPVPELFRRAWRRVTDGDAPGFEEFISRRGRRGGRGGAR